MAVSNGGMTLYTDNNTQQNWAGTDDLDLEVSVDGGGSESWLIGKNTTETATLTLTRNMGSSKYFTFWVKSDWGSFYTSITARLFDGANLNSFVVATGGKFTPPNPTPEISGDFKPSILQITEGSAGGSYNPANHTQFSLVVDASSTGNIRAIVNHWIDTMWYGNGRVISGTTTNNFLFKESDDLDTSTASYDGCSKVFDSGLAYYTDVTIATTAGFSYGEVVTWFGKSTTDRVFNLTITGVAEFQNTSLIGNNSTIGLDASSAGSFSMIGGGITNGGNIIFAAGNNVTGCVFSNAIGFSVGNILSSCTISSSGAVALVGGLDSCTIKDTTAQSAVIATTLNNITNCNFISDGSSHAVDIGTISSNITMDWDNSFSNYATNDGQTGNEVILVNVASGVTLTINSANGTPSVRNIGAGTVNVVSGQVTFTLTVKDTSGEIIQGAMVYVVAASGGGLPIGTPIIDKVLTDVNGQVSDTRSLGSNQPITGKVRKSTNAPFYKTTPVVGTISSTAGLDLTVQMILDQ